MNCQANENRRAGLKEGRALLSSAWEQIAGLNATTESESGGMARKAGWGAAWTHLRTKITTQGKRKKRALFWVGKALRNAEVSLFREDGSQVQTRSEEQ